MERCGWEDDSILLLLQLFRSHVNEYIYGTEADFMKVIQPHLQGKREQDIRTIFRSLLVTLNLKVPDKSFKSELLQTSSGVVYAHEHLYQTVVELPENKVGIILLPEELRAFVCKLRMFRGVLDRSADLFFTRTQIISKSIQQTKQKFYALRDMYLKEFQDPPQESGGQKKRNEMLRFIFSNVKERQVEREEPPDLVKPSKVKVNTNKATMWSTQDLEILVEKVVEITQEVQTDGTSQLIINLPKMLKRTPASVLSKIYNIRERCVKNTRSYRTATLPDVLFDTTSMAYRIFHSDWLNLEDFNAIGIHAIRRYCGNKKRGRKPSLIALRSPQPQHAVRPQSTTISPTAISRPSSSCRPASNIQPQSISQLPPTSDLPPFLNDLAEEQQEDVEICTKVAQAMYVHLPFANAKKSDVLSAASMELSSVGPLYINYIYDLIVGKLEASNVSIDALGPKVLGLPSHPKSKQATSETVKRVTETETAAHADDSERRTEMNDSDVHPVQQDIDQPSAEYNDTNGVNKSASSVSNGSVQESEQGLCRSCGREANAPQAESEDEESTSASLFLQNLLHQEKERGRVIQLKRRELMEREEDARRHPKYARRTRELRTSLYDTFVQGA